MGGVLTSVENLTDGETYISVAREGDDSVFGENMAADLKKAEGMFRAELRKNGIEFSGNIHVVVGGLNGHNGNGYGKCAKLLLYLLY